MKVKDEIDHLYNKKNIGYSSYEGSKTKRVTSLFMAAALAVSAGCYFADSASQDDQEDQNGQNGQHYHSVFSGSRYHNYSTINTNSSHVSSSHISDGISAAKGGLGSSAVGGGE